MRGAPTKYTPEIVDAIELLWQTRTMTEIVEILRVKYGIETTISGLKNLSHRMDFNSPHKLKNEAMEPDERPGIAGQWFENLRKPGPPPDNARMANVVRHPVPHGGYRMGMSP